MSIASVPGRSCGRGDLARPRLAFRGGAVEVQL